MQPEEATSVKTRLEESVGLLNGILDGTKTITEKAEETAQAVEPIARRLEPLVQKLAVAALWTSKMWLQG